MQRVALHHLAARAHGFRTRLHNKQLAGVTIFSPLDIHRAAIVFLNLYGLFRQFLHLFRRDAETVAFSLRDIFDAHLLAVLLGIGIHHTDFFRAHGTAHNRRTPFRQARFMHVEFVRVDRTLHHHFAKTIRGGDKHHLVEARFGINGEHHARGREIGAHHTLHARGERDAAVIVSLMHAVRDGAVIKQRGEHMFHRHHHRIDALHVQEGFLLAREGSVRHIFGGGGRAHRKGGVGVIGGELLIGFADRLLQLRLEGGVDNPLADLRAGFRELSDVVDICFIQQFIDTLVNATAFEELIKRHGSGRKPVRHRDAHTGQVSNHFTEGGVFAPNSVYIIHAELVIPKYER
ncbi:hypothetical protein BN130_390 [Cronobacter malonaticus 507]|nr:hypothetical protein BN130_390 [Cronobacter malonaticus 507]